MKVVVVANKSQAAELISGGTSADLQVEWIDSPAALLHGAAADAFIDLLFDATRERIELLKQINAKAIFVNSVTSTLGELPDGWIRLNGWNGFLKRMVTEISCADKSRSTAGSILSLFNRTVTHIPDIPGFISCRVVSMIINEAYYTLQDKVSSKADIDTAMKLGTNYPYGPFEWGEIIGLKNIVALLQTLALTDKRYEPSPLLIKESFL